MPAMISGTTICPYPTPGSICQASSPSPVACNASPVSMKGRVPNRSASAPATGATSRGMAFHTRMRTPASSGE